MKKLVVLILAVLPLISGAQTRSSGQPMVLSFNEKSMYKNYVVPLGSVLRVSRIYSEAGGVIKVKISVEAEGVANQQKFTQSMSFSRGDLGNFSDTGIVLPEKSVIEYDGVPILIFCSVEKVYNR